MEARYVYPLQVLTLAGLYVASGWLGLQVALYNENSSLVWPPTGIALAALLLLGRRLWIGIWLGAFLVNFLNGLPALVSMEIAIGNSLMPLLGAWLLARVFDFRPGLERVHDVVVLVLAGGALPAAVSAAGGVAALWSAGLIPTSEIGPVLSIWWRGDFLGVVAFAPLLLLLRDDDGEWRRLFRKPFFWSLVGVGLALLVLAYSGVLPTDWEKIPARLVIPLLIWVAISLGARACTLLYVGVLVPAVTATYFQVGPMAKFGVVLGSEQLWLYLMITGCVPLAIAAIMRQRDDALAQQRLEAIERMRIERVNAIGAERDRILRDMHDGVGGQLTSILSMVQRGAATNEEIGEALRRALDDMRIMIDAVEASDMGLTVLIGRVRARLEPLLRRNGLRATWSVETLEALDEFDPGQALHILRIVQEAITNVVKHAHATRVEVRVYAADSNEEILAIEIADNGTGPAPGSTNRGRGMENMKTRARALGAEIRFEVVDPGYRVLLLIPSPRST